MCRCTSSPGASEMALCQISSGTKFVGAGAAAAPPQVAIVQRKTAVAGSPAGAAGSLLACSSRRAGEPNHGASWSKMNLSGGPNRLPVEVYRHAVQLGVFATVHGSLAMTGVLPSPKWIHGTASPAPRSGHTWQTATTRWPRTADLHTRQACVAEFCHPAAMPHGTLAAITDVRQHSILCGKNAAVLVDVCSACNMSGRLPRTIPHVRWRSTSICCDSCFPWWSVAKLGDQRRSVEKLHVRWKSAG